MLRFSKGAIALSVLLPTTAIQVTQCSVAVARERLNAQAVRNNIAHASKDEMCHVYVDRFIDAVAARLKASSRENDAEGLQSLDRLDAKIIAANERLAEECGG
jgi:hypothetical protein